MAVAAFDHRHRRGAVHTVQPRAALAVIPAVGHVAAAHQARQDFLPEAFVMHVAPRLREPLLRAHRRRQKEVIHADGLRMVQRGQRIRQRALARPAGPVQHRQRAAALGQLPLNSYHCGHQRPQVLAHHAVGRGVGRPVCLAVAHGRMSVPAAEKSLQAFRRKRRFPRAGQLPQRFQPGVHCRPAAQGLRHGHAHHVRDSPRRQLLHRGRRQVQPAQPVPNGRTHRHVPARGRARQLLSNPARAVFR